MSESSRRILMEKIAGCGKVSNLRHPRETDFNSVVITTWVRSVKMSLRRNHPRVDPKVVIDRKNLIASMFRTCAIQEKQISIPL
jgi:hypothetical protein